AMVGHEQPAALQELPTPVVPSKTVRVAERPPKSQPRRDTPRAAAVPPLQHTPLPLPADQGDGAPASTVQSEARASAVAPGRSAALQENPPPAVPPQAMRNPERFKPRTVQRDRRATQPVRDRAAPHDSTQRAVAVSHVGSSDTLWPEGIPRLVVEAGGHVAMIREL